MSSFDAIINANLIGQRALINKVLHASTMFDANALEIKGRFTRFGNHWVVDFASCNYLGFDLHDEIIQSIEPALYKWGVHPSWCRLVASPSLYVEAEEQFAELIGADETLILPTVTLISIGVIPALTAKDGVMFLDKSAHMTMYEAAKIARDSGAKLISFTHNDFTMLEDGLKQHQNNPKKVIMVDGAYSMTGNYVNIPVIVDLARQYNAVLYIDDAHGFGVVGECPDAELPYGYKGNGVIKHFNYDYDNVLYVGGLSKAYSSLAAFISCDKKMKNYLKAYATPYDLSGPCPTASLQSILTGLRVNAKEGDALRLTLYRLTKRAIDGLRAMNFVIDNNTYYPIISVWIGDTDQLIQTAKILWENQILVTLAPYPMVKKGHEALRITVTAANTDAEIDLLLNAFQKVRFFLEEQNHALPVNY
jgi:8-amino-7-oxononanoate synthase